VAALNPHILSVPHAQDPLVTPTYDDSGETVHPSVRDYGSAWNGYRYWMAMTPYTNGSGDTENPSILASNDKETWVVPEGLTNPIDAPAAPAFYHDPELLFDGATLWCIYSNIYAKSSTDGVTWSARQSLVGTYGSLGGASQTIALLDGVYHLWCCDDNANPVTLIHETATAFLGPYSDRATCTVTGLPGDRDLWHVSVVRYGEQWIAAITTCILGTSGEQAALHLAVSDDGLAWSMPVIPHMEPGSGLWDTTSVYRASLVPLPVSGGAELFDLYYSALHSLGNNTYQWHIGRTQVLDSTIVAITPQFHNYGSWLTCAPPRVWVEDSWRVCSILFRTGGEWV
jgi:hypothetical protein